MSQCIVHLHGSPIYLVCLLLKIEHLSDPCYLCSLLLYLIKIGIWFVGVEYLVAVHYCYQVFSVGEVDDVVGVTREHDDRLYFVTTYFIVQYFICAFLAKLDKSVTCNHNKLFPLGIVPMLTFSDAWFGNIYAYLSTVESVYQLGERAAGVYVHFQIEDSFFFGQVA